VTIVTQPVRAVNGTDQSINSYEQDDEDTRSQIAHRAAVIAYTVAVATVVAPVAATSWTGLTGWAETTLHLHGWQRDLVPLALDGAAMTCAALAIEATLSGESAAGLRILMLGLMGASAGFNYMHAHAQLRSTAAAVFFGAMSLTATAMFDLILRRARRRALRDAGRIEAPLPRFRVVRWLRFPGETFHAWSAAVRWGLISPHEALERVRAEARTGDGEELAPPLIPGELAALTKRQALMRAVDEIGSLDVPTVLEWLGDRGVDVDRSYAYTVLGRVARDRRALPTGDNNPTTPPQQPPANVA